MFRPILIYLLLCYGKKFIDANDTGYRRPYSSHEPPDPALTETFYLNTHTSHNESFNLSQEQAYLRDSKAHYSNSYNYYADEKHNPVHLSKIDKRPKFNHNDNYYSDNDNVSQNRRVNDLDRNGRRILRPSKEFNHKNSYRRYDSSPYEDESFDSEGKLARFKNNYRAQKSNNLLTVDIDKRRSSSLIRFERNESGHYDIFTPLKPYLVSRVTKGEKELWSSKNGAHSDRVWVKYLGNGQVKLRMFYPDQRKDTSDDQYTSSGSSSDAPIQKRYRLISIDVDNTFSTDQVVFRIECDGTRSLVCRPGFLVNSVFKGDFLLWAYNEIDGNYVNRIYLSVDDMGKEIVNVRFPGDEILVSLDVDYKKSTDKIVYLVRRDGNEIFSCRPGYVFAQIYSGDRLLWKCQDGVYSDIALVVYNEKGERVLRLFYPHYEQERLKPKPEPRPKPSQPPKPKLDKFPELIELDIKNAHKSDKIIPSIDEKGTKTFTCKPGYLLTKVTKGSKTLWDSEGENFADKFFLYIGPNGKPFLRVSYYPLELLPEHLRVPKPKKPEVVSVRKEVVVRPVSKEPEDIVDVKEPEPVDDSKFRHRVLSLEDLRLFIVDPNLKKGEDEFEYEKAEFDNVDMTVPKDSYRVFKPKTVDKPVKPKHDAMPSKVLMLFDEPEKLKPPVKPKPEVEPEKPKVEVKKEEVKPEPEKAPEEETVAEGEPEEPERKLVPISLDLSNRKTTAELGYLPSGKTATFIAKGDSIINKVTIKDSTIWSETDPLKFSTKVGMDGIGMFKSTKNVSIYQPDGKILHFLKSSSGEWKKISNQWILDINKQSNTYIFNYDEGYGEGTYTPKEDFIFKGLEDRSVTTRCLSIFNKRYVNIWVSDSAAENTKKAIIDGTSFASYIKNISIYMENGNFRHFHRSSKFLPWKQISNHISLNVNIKKSTYRFFYKVYDLGTYTTNHDFVFTVIRHDSFYLNRKGIDVIWKTDSENDSDCANKVVIDGTGANSVPLNVTIFLVNGAIKHFSRETFFSPWNEISNKVELDINIIDSSMQIDVTLDKRFKYFSVNHNFEIKRIRDKKNVIWQSENGEFCKKVIFKGVKSEHKELTVFLPQGPRVFRKKSKNDSWVDVSLKSKDDSASISGSTDGNNPDRLAKLKEDLVNSFSQSKISIQTEGSAQINDASTFETKTEEDDVIFDMNNDSKCIGVKYGENVLWEYDKQVHGDLYPKKVHFIKNKLLVVVDLNVISFVYRYGADDQMNLVYTKKPVPVEIDLGDYESMVEVKFEINSSHAIFEAREHYSINPLKYGPTKIFDSDDIFNYIVKVKVEPPSSPKKIYIELLNGMKKLFKGSDKSWQEVPVA